MERRPQDPLATPGRILLGALVRLARERRDVRDALTVVHQWLGRQLEPLDSHAGESPGRQRTPAHGEGRAEQTSSVDLSSVVRRARWKAAACRLSIDRQRATKLGAGSTPELRRIEEGLRAWIPAFDAVVAPPALLARLPSIVPGPQIVMFLLNGGGVCRPDPT